MSTTSRMTSGPKGMTAVTLKGLWANRSRFGLSALAVVISVAFLTAILLLTQAISGTASEDIAAANAGIDGVVEGVQIGTGEGPPGAEASIQASVPAATLASVQSVDAVADAVGVQSGYAQVVDGDGELVTNAALVYESRNWVENSDLNPYTLAAGSAPVADGQVVLEVGIAEAADVAVGDPVTVATASGSIEATVTGLATYGGADGAPATSAVLFDDAQASALAVDPGFDRVLVQFVEGADEVSALQAIEAAAGSTDVVVLAGSDFVAETQAAIEARTSFQSIFLLAFALIALIAGVTIIYNTFVIAVAQRTRELALLRSIGASRRQVLGSVMSEAAVIGVVASAAGAALGVLGAFGLSAFFETIGLSFLEGGVSVSTTPLLTGALVGLVVTLLSAWFPARSAAGIPPIAALRDASVDVSATSNVRNAAAAMLLVGGIGACVWGAAAASWEPAVAGIVSTFVGVVVGGPLIAGLVASVIGRPIQRVVGVVGGLARTNAVRNPRRSASTALALTLGVGLVTFFTIIAGSMSGTAASDAEAALRADAVVRSSAPAQGPNQPSSIPSDLAGDVAAIDGVDAVSAVANTMVVIDGEGTLLAGIDVDSIDTTYDLAVSAGSLDDLAVGTIAVAAGAADGLDIGDAVTVQIPQQGSVTYTVAALYENNLPGTEPAEYLVAGDVLEAAAPGMADSVVFLTFDGSSDSAMAALEASVDATPGATLQTVDEYIDSLGGAIDTFRNFVYAMLGVAVLIALVGIANTTVMAVNERTRELGMLRAVGMTARQVRRMVRTESLMLSIQGAGVGLLLGIGGAAAAFAALSAEEGIALVVPYGQLAWIAGLAAASGVLAAAWPAWRASRLDPLEAMAA